MYFMQCENCDKYYWINDNATLENCHICGSASLNIVEIDSTYDFIYIHDENELKRQYEVVLPQYKSFCEQLRKKIKRLLDDNNIDFFDVTCRMKKFDEFLKKTRIKNYGNPIEQIDDFCGIRVICFYSSDLERIAKLIKDNFFILESPSEPFQVKRPDQFSYRSMHFSARFKDYYLCRHPELGIYCLRGEIQLRTVLMHAWADVSHELIYKHENTVSTKLKHDLNRLSAMLEIADEQFDILRKEQDEYTNRFFDDKGNFNLELELNVVNFVAFLDFCFPDLYQSPITDVKNLLKKILDYNDKNEENKLNFENLLENYEKFNWKFKGNPHYSWEQAMRLDNILSISGVYDWDSCFGA